MYLGNRLVRSLRGWQNTEFSQTWVGTAGYYLWNEVVKMKQPEVIQIFSFFHGFQCLPHTELQVENIALGPKLFLEQSRSSPIFPQAPGIRQYHGWLRRSESWNPGVRN